MKKLLAIMCVFVMSLSLMACGDTADKGKTENTESKTETKSDNIMKDVKWDDWTISVNGCVIKLGETKVSEAEKAGLGEFVQTSGLPIEKTYIKNGASFGNFETLLNKVYYISFTYQNKGEAEVTEDDCTICILNLERENTEEIKDLDIVLPGGFDFETSKISAIVDAYGEPTSTFKEDNGTTRYTWSVIDTGSLGIYADDAGNILEIAYHG